MVPEEKIECAIISLNSYRIFLSGACNLFAYYVYRDPLRPLLVAWLRLGTTTVSLSLLLLVMLSLSLFLLLLLLLPLLPVMTFHFLALERRNRRGS